MGAGLVPDLSNAYQCRSISLFWGASRVWKSLIWRDKVGKYASQDKGEDTEERKKCDLTGKGQVKLGCRG